MPAPAKPEYLAALDVAQQAGGPLLAVDTSGLVASVCLVLPRHGRVVERSLPAATQPSETLALALTELFDAAGMRPDALRAMVVSLGPGSFTGLRVGLATLKGLALGSGVALHGVSSLAVLAASHGPGWVSPVIDARRDELYGALYKVDATSGVEAVIADGVYDVAAWHARCNAPAGEAIRFVGDLAGSFGQPAHSAATPRAIYGLLLCQHAILHGPVTALESLVPRYLRLSEAERQLQLKQQAAMARG